VKLGQAKEALAGGDRTKLNQVEMAFANVCRNYRRVIRRKGLKMLFS
jgi:hypothetical protein